MSKIIVKVFKNIIQYFENQNIGIFSLLLSFFFAVSLRNFLEGFSDIGEISYNSFLHFYSAYTALALTIILLFVLGTKESVLKVSKVVFPCFLILLLPPVLDLIISHGKGFDMNYMLPGLHDDLLTRYLTFFGPLEPMAVTPGIRIELAIVLILSLIYLFIKTNSLLKSIFLTWLLYTIFFVFGAYPFLLIGLKKITGISFWHTEPILTFSFIILSIILGVALTYLANPNLFKLVLKDVCKYRVIHYELMPVLGVVIGLYAIDYFKLTPHILFYFLLIPISLFFSGMNALIGNNIVDVEIDRMSLSNKDRALASKKVDLSFYKSLQFPFALIGMFLATLISFKILFLMVLFMGNYYIYSMPPLRLKRIPFFSKLIISLNSLIMVMAGYIIIMGSLEGFPHILTLFFLVLFTFPINFTDLKDSDGNKKASIYTLPVVLGEKGAKHFIGISFLITYVLINFLIKSTYLLVPMVGFGLLQYYWVTRSDYKESRVFITYLISLIGFIIHIAIHGPSF